MKPRFIVFVLVSSGHNEIIVFFVLVQTNWRRSFSFSSDDNEKTNENEIMNECKALHNSWVIWAVSRSVPIRFSSSDRFYQFRWAEVAEGDVKSKSSVLPVKAELTRRKR